MIIEKPAESRRAAVYERLRRDLASGRIAPGEKLSELGLAETLGVSRTPVREALSQLMNDGLLVALGRGYTRPDLTPRDVENIYEMRLLLEPAIARHAAENASLKNVQEMEDALAAEARTAEDPDPAPFIDANLAFRSALLKPCPNDRLVSNASLYVDQICQVMHMTLGPPSNRQTTVDHHREIVDGVRGRDADRAAAAMASLLHHARESYRALPEAFGE